MSMNITQAVVFPSWILPITIISGMIVLGFALYVFYHVSKMNINNYNKEGEQNL